MKGIPDKALINHCNVNYGGDIFKCYENLANNNEEVIVLNYNQHNPSFEFTNTGVQFRELGSFKRTISFKN
jgi:predicted transcriptional regulator